MGRIVRSLLSLIAVACAVGCSSHNLEGYFGPIYSPDGRAVYFVQRNTVGQAWGMGWEFFSPPANVWIVRDTVSIRRLDLASGKVAVLRSWANSPLTGRRLRQYHSRIFGILNARLGWDSSSNLHYAITVSAARVPQTEYHSVSGQLTSGVEHSSDGAWQPGQAPLRVQDGLVLSGEWEVMELPGEEMFPAALVALAADRDEIRVLLKNSDFSDLYPEGVEIKPLRERARRPGIERARTIERVRQELIAQFRSAGATEIDAELRTIKEMRRLGCYPKEPTLTARLLAAGENREEQIPEFVVDPMQFRVGLLQDIHKAISSPGEAIDKDFGGYIVHRDYDTSQKLNSYLEAGGARFYVRSEGKVFELKIERPK